MLMGCVLHSWDLSQVSYLCFRLFGRGGVRTVNIEGFVASDIPGLRGQICTTFGPNVNCVRQVDF